MGRIRTIKPEFPQSETIGKLSREARLFFIQLWTICDDEGRTRAASRMLASLLYPYDDDAPSLIDEWIAETERAGCITCYVVDGSKYIQVNKWLIHQKIDRPSKSRIPQIDEHSRGFNEHSTNGRDVLDADLGPRNVPSTKEQEPRARDEKEPTQAAMITGALLKIGVQASPTDPRLIKLLEAGVTKEEILAAAENGAARKGFNYILGKVEGIRRDAAEMAITPKTSTPKPPEPTRLEKRTGKMVNLAEELPKVLKGLA